MREIFSYESVGERRATAAPTRKRIRTSLPRLMYSWFSFVDRYAHNIFSLRTDKAFR